MNDTAIKNFCIWARNELREQVRQKLMEWKITDEDDAALDAIGGRPLTDEEKKQRRDLMAELRELGEEGLVEKAAYTWFNRFVAIRYMEVNDLLPSHTRFFSDGSGAFGSLAIREALSLEIDGLDRDQTIRLVQAGDDDVLLRHLLLAQCDELSACLPDVFEPIGSAMELLLPDGLLRHGGVIERMVQDIPEDDWKQGVEIVGWMYQHYNAERKDEVFASFKKGKKADSAALAPATQLFTPDWIVSYLVENSLGRLWMRSHPDSRLVDQMPYYIPSVISSKADTPPVISSEAERSREISPLSPESITLVDPACGSGHILVCAFRLLAAMYEEAGYTRRDIPRLILEKNLMGIEIDPRAVQLASFALAMTACEWDARFLQRSDKVSARITCLRPAEISATELAMMPYLADRAKLLDAMAHADECGSLFVPERKDLDALEQAADELDARMGGGDLLAYAPNAAVETMLANCEPLARTYDVVVANPPYMGSSNMDKWLADWTKKNYPDSKRDLCTCFIERSFTLAKPKGYSAMITMQSWMFLSNAEKLRSKLLKAFSIESMAHLGARAFDSIGGEVVSTTATVFRKSANGDSGSYVRLVDYGNEADKQAALKEAIANPDCGWFYRRDAASFSAIPGTPIAYWLPASFVESFDKGVSIDSLSSFTGSQNKTANNEKFLRRWWEVSNSDFAPSEKWIFYSKGGDFRRWYGNLERIINWTPNARVFYSSNPTSNLLSERYWYKEGVMYTMLTSGKPNFRYMPSIGVFDMGGPEICNLAKNLNYVLGFLNSSITELYLGAMNPTLNLQAKDLKALPIILSKKQGKLIDKRVDECISISKSDWDSFETSWDFQRHPMVGDRS